MLDMTSIPRTVVLIASLLLMYATPAFLIARFGQQPPGRVQILLDRWHQFERPLVATDGHPLAGLVTDLLDGIGPTRVERNGERLSIDFSQ